MSCTKTVAEQATSTKQRVLIVVKGGVADFVADDGIDVVIFDWDDYKDAPELAAIPSAEYGDLAMRCGIPLALALETT